MDDFKLKEYNIQINKLCKRYWGLNIISWKNYHQCLNNMIEEIYNYGKENK